jgi:two-component system, chemotaxis family, chemotaxis protein CheY
MPPTGDFVSLFIFFVMAQRILIVDDSLYMRTTLRNILADAGYTIVGEAATGAEALELVGKTEPDLVTLDVILPDCTGLEILRSIRAQRPAQLIVMVSAIGQNSIVCEALALGAGAYLVKPFSEARVLAIIAQLLAGVQAVN